MKTAITAALVINMSLWTCWAASASKVTLTVINPRAQLAQPPITPPQPRISDLSGKKIGIYWNGKAGGNYFWNNIERLLKEKLPQTTVLRYEGPYEISENAALKMASEVDAFFYGVGD